MRLETAFPFGIYNPNVQSVTVRVMQVWYAELTDPFSSNFLLIPKVNLKYISLDKGNTSFTVEWYPPSFGDAFNIEVYHGSQIIFWTDIDASSGQLIGCFDEGIGWEVTFKMWFSQAGYNGPIIERKGVIGSGQIIT
jgi:hypothetical protein